MRTDGLGQRRAVRALVLDDRDRVLLLRYELPGPPRTVWATPGGGIEDGEDDHAALRRELDEELGLRDPPLGPLIWTRSHRIPMPTGHDGQRERFYLVLTPPFVPRPRFTPEQLRAEHVHELRWWTPPELAGAAAVFAPRRLPALLARLRADGPPAAPVDVGV